jgi:hypothetical protein
MPSVRGKMLGKLALPTWHLPSVTFGKDSAEYFVLSYTLAKNHVVRPCLVSDM